MSLKENRKGAGMKKEKINLNDYAITECFENGYNLIEYFKTKNICYYTFKKLWNEKVNISISRCKNIYLYDTIERLKQKAS